MESGHKLSLFLLYSNLLEALRRLLSQLYTLLHRKGCRDQL